jgi:ataxia telangiectasia mutated family protein
MSVLRQNQETILTILEVLLYDPLYAWTVSPTKGYNIQQRTNKADLSYSESEGKKSSQMFPIIFSPVNVKQLSCTF